MSDYTKTTSFGPKDSLATGDSNKLVVGAQFDTEFDDIATAVATKYDNTNLATEAQAQAGVAVSPEVLMTPLRAEDHITTWAAENDGMIADLHALNLSADAILYWDESDAAVQALTADNGLTIDSDDTIGLTDQTATTSNPMIRSSGTISLDIEALTTMQGNALAATDTFYVDDAGVSKGIEYQDMGVIVQTGQGSQTLALADANTLMEFNGTATLTIPLNATVAMPIGSAIIIVVDHASQQVTITAATSVTLNSIFHAGGGSAASDKVDAGGTAVLIKTEADEWYLSGDIVT